MTINKPMVNMAHEDKFISQFGKILSLRMLKELHLNNTEEIESLAINYETVLIISTSLPALIGILIVIWVSLKLIKKRKQIVQITVEENIQKPLALDNTNTVVGFEKINSFTNNFCF